VLPACLAESFFYLASLWQTTRESFARWRSPLLQAFVVLCSALLPYLILSWNIGTFSARAFELLAFLVAILTFWFVFAPRRLIYDLGFLAIAAAPIVARVFHRIYPVPDPHLRLQILGQLMWIRVAVFALLAVRQWNPGPVGLWPTKREWKIGARWFGIGIIPLSVLATAIHDVRLVPSFGALALLVGVVTFFAFFWTSGLAEELFFRGVVERFLLDRWNKIGAVVTSAVFFGAVHLWFHGFPDWRRATTAFVLGLTCGIAYADSGTIRASMVTHSLVVAVLKAFFR
jgi:membrane protease YdiL (CAAX protease family)